MADCTCTRVGGWNSASTSPEKRDGLNRERSHCSASDEQSSLIRAIGRADDRDLLR